MSKWKWIRFDGAVSHAVPEQLEAGIIDDLVRRDCDVQSVDDSDGMSIDIPGPVALNRPWEEFVVHGYRVEVPCEDVEDMFERLSDLQARHTRTGEIYYKLHGFMRCLVLTPDQREELLFQMADRIPEANARSEEFYRTRKTPAQALREANERATGQSLPEGMFRDRHARFQKDDEELN